MALSCGAKCLKYCLFAFNLIFVIAGIVCLSIGLWLVFSPNHAIGDITSAFKTMKLNNATIGAAEDLSHAPSTVKNLGIGLASGGGAVLLIAFLGCCGAVKEWRPLLIFYAFFLMVIVAVEVAIAIYVAVERNKIEHEFKEYLEKSLKHYGNASNSEMNAMRKTWDSFMRTNDCCGVAKDWKGDRGFNHSVWSKIREVPTCAHVHYPDACCGKTNVKFVMDCGAVKNVTTFCQTPTAEGMPGCYETLKNTLENQMAIIIGVGVAVGLIQIIGIIFSLCLCRAISADEV